jgi:Fe-S-cluster containining protein
VKLSQEELARLAVHRNMSEHDFIQRFTRLRADRHGLALMDKPNGECIFLEGIECTVQAVKPQQCRDFPNLWNFPGAAQACQAIPREMTTREWRQRVLETTGRRTLPQT